MELLAIGMWILPAGPGARLVYGAVIIGAQKRAGRCVKYIVALTVEVEILLDEVSRSHIKVAGQAFDIYVAKNGTGRFAAVGTLQAIDLREDLIVQLMHGLVEIFWGTPLKPLKELFKPLAMVEGALSYLRGMNHRK